MARRRKRSDSFLEVLFEFASLVPWPVSLALAAAIFVGLHIYSNSPAPPLTVENPADSLTFMFANMWRTAAGVGKYLLPLPLLLGAVFSAHSRRRQQNLHQHVAANPAPDALESMTWQEFEGLVAETFRQKGYRVVERGGDGPDGGVDLELYLGEDKYLVQCKQWKTRQVGVAVVRELYGVMAAEGAVGGFIVASGFFTFDAHQFVKGRAIELVDARKLRRLIGGEQATPAAETATTVTAPACPVCAGPMVTRTVKGGPNVGTQFWGCSKFPKCRGVRNQ